jgi:hypothetical protein
MISRAGSPRRQPEPKASLMRAIRLAVAAAMLVIYLPLAQAQEAIPIHPALHDRFYMGVGAFLPKTSTSAQLDSTNLGVGANVDFERMLGMTTQKVVPDAFARWRFAERWRVEAEYFQLNRNGDKVLDQSITWNGQTFSAGTEVISKFDFSDIRTSVGYSFFKTPDKELGVAFGFHVASYDVALGSATVSNQGKAILAPLPVLSAYGQFALTETWAVGARMDRLMMSYDHYAGNVTSIAVDVNYQPFRHVGFGLAYRSLFINLKATGTDFTAQFNQTFQGPLLYMNASF